MRVSVKVSKSPFKAMVAASGAFAAEISEQAANDIADEADRLIFSGSKSGKFYGGNRVRSSAPGESPASQSGALIRSRTVRGRGPVFRVGYAVKYASMLEYGTSRIAPRPFLRRAVSNIMGRRANQVRWVGAAGRKKLGKWFKR